MINNMNDKKKSYWDRLATKDDVFNAMVAAVVTISLGIIIGKLVLFANF